MANGANEMQLSDVIPAKWKGTLAVALLGLVVGGGGSTALWNLGPGQAVATKVTENAEANGKLAANLTRLAEIVEQLQKRMDQFSDVQTRRYDIIAGLDARLKVMEATQANDRASFDANLKRLEHTLDRLATKMDSKPQG